MSTRDDLLVRGLLVTLLLIAGCGGSSSQPHPSSTTTTAATAAATPTPGACCAPERVTLVSSAGTLRVDNLPAWSFPAGVVTTIDTGPATGAAGECRHDAVIPAGGFRVPHFDLPTLNYCAEIVDRHCERGDGEGAGALWDGSGTPGLATTNVGKSADTNDGTCDVTFTGANCTTAVGGAGANTLGNIDTTFAAAAGGGLRARFDVRVGLRVWKDSTCSPAITPGCCPSATYGDHTSDDGEVLISAFDFILSPTTNEAKASFADQNGDGCFRAGSGFDNPGPNGPRTLDGTAAPGPCCAVGQATTLVAVGIGFSGRGPLFDLGFQATIPSSIAACEAPGTAACTVTTDPCLE